MKLCELPWPRFQCRHRGKALSHRLPCTATASNRQRECELQVPRPDVGRFAFAAWFSPDGARLVTISDNDSAKLWNVATGKLLVSYDGHKGDIRDVRFSSDGRLLTTSADGTVKLWEEHTGRLLSSFDADALDAKFSPDGTQLTIAPHDGQISIWDIHLEQRAADEIQRLVTARNPWTLTDGVLLPHDR